MLPFDAAIVATLGAVCLALCSVMLALSERRRARRGMDLANARMAEAQQAAAAARSGADAFQSALVAVADGTARLALGEEALTDCARALGAEDDVESVLDAIGRSDPDSSRRIAALVERGEPCVFEVRGPAGTVTVEGRAAGAVAWLRLSAAAGAGLPSAARFAAFLDAQPFPAWIVASGRGARGGPLLWANRAWLEAAEASSLEDALRRGLVFDRGVQQLTAEAAAGGERRTALRWAPVRGQRRAFQVVAAPLEGGGAGALALDVTETEELREAFRRHVSSHDQTLNHLADAVAIFAPSKRLAFHNTAFAELWGLEDAWLGERPSHAEVLDRLRQRRRLPETSDYAGFKGRELGFYEALEAPPDELWSVPGGRTLRVVRQPHPLGGLLLLFSDITDELKLKAQYNALIGVQQATLDKLKDAVAVFGSDGGLRLHNEAFEQFWRIGAGVLTDTTDFDAVVERCLPYLHDMRFWRELKARVADPDPQARAPISGEVRASDGRHVSYQSRPLPDGATLIAFADVTATKELERALADRSAALSDAERLKRDFVGNVSYELRTPLTTIIGYSELLDRQGEALPERARGHVAAVRTAAGQLAASIDDVLDMAAIDAGELALQLGDTRVDELLQGAAQRVARAAEQARVQVVVSAGPDSGLIRADEKRLGQVLDHLVANAVRASPTDGTVTLAARRALGEVQIQVTDSGRGIPFAVQAHIFDRFVSRDRGGPGLGLALVKAIIELHGGWVALESEPGRGAVFTCHLPERAYAGAAPQTELAFVA
jgi:hypothetical protein